MPTEQFSFESLEPIERRVMRLAEDIGYLVLYDRSNHRKEDNLGRIDLTESDLEPFRELWAEEDDEDPPRSRFRHPVPADRHDDVDDEEREPLSPRVLAEFACRWVREIAASNTVGETSARFRLRVYAPKGNRMLFSGQFLCRNRGLEEAAERGTDMTIPPPSYEEAVSQASVHGVRALGDFYAQWGRIVLGAVGELQGVNNEMMSRLHHQLQDSRGQVDELVGAILNHRIEEMTARDAKEAIEHEGDARTALAREAINQLGSAAQAFLASKGITPEMADLFGVLASSPELMDALKDPTVRALMQDPTNLSSLAQMLRGAAQQAQAMQQVQQQAQAPTGGESPVQAPPTSTPIPNPAPAAG